MKGGSRSRRLCLSSSQIWNTTSLLQQLGIIRQRLEDIRLAKGKLDFFLLIVEGDDEIFNLDLFLARSCPPA